VAPRQQEVDRERKYRSALACARSCPVADNLGRALSALPADLESIDPALRNVITAVQATSAS